MPEHESKKSQDEPAMIALAKGTAHQVRLAGLGALSIAQQFVDVLVEEGKRFEARLQAPADDDLPRLAGPAPAARNLSPENVAQLEDLFQARIARTLTQLQIPTAQDLQSLHRQMDSLSRSIKQLAEDAQSG